MRHYVLYDALLCDVVAYLHACKLFGYLTSASLAQHIPLDGVTHIHVIADFTHGVDAGRIFKNFGICAMVDVIRCDESTWRGYLSEDGKTEIIDI